MNGMTRAQTPPEWHFKEAILDFVSFDPGSLWYLYNDCTIHNSISQRNLRAGSASKPSLAMHLAARQKAEKYPGKNSLHFSTAAVGQYVYISEEVLSLFQRLAAQAVAADVAYEHPAHS